MANFFKDNPDIIFNFDTMDLAEIARWQEKDFADKGKYDYAPDDEKDAIDSYRRILEVVGEMAGERIAPNNESIDLEGNKLEDGKVTYAQGIQDAIRDLSLSDLMGFTLPRKYEGLNMPNLVYTMAIEMVSRADASLMNIFGLQGIAETINAFASEEIKAKYLPRFSRGEVTGAMALTEPDAGSDLQNVQLRAFQDENGNWKLRGVKRFITNGCGEILLVLARSEENEQGGLGLSLFLCEQSKDVVVRRIENKLGIHGSPTCELQFNDAPCLLIGERRRGLITYVMALMNGARIGIAAQSLGIAQAAFEEARKYARTREQFGVSIDRLPAVSELLTDMCISIEAARALTYETSRVVDILISMSHKTEELKATDKEKSATLGKQAKQISRLASLLTPMSKYYSSEMCNKVASDAIQVLGGSGYMKDYPVERYFRDARITNIYEGTSQLQVVAAIRGTTSGIAEKRFVEIESEIKKLAPGEEFKPLFDSLTETRQLLQEAVSFAKSKSGAYLDLYAKDIVDIAIDILIGYLFIKQATKSSRKFDIAKRFISKMLPCAKMKRDHVLSEEDLPIRAFNEVVGTSSSAE